MGIVKGMNDALFACIDSNYHEILEVGRKLQRGNDGWRTKTLTRCWKQGYGVGRPLAGITGSDWDRTGMSGVQDRPMIYWTIIMMIECKRSLNDSRLRLGRGSNESGF